ncbi:MAG: hypothetical protein ACRELF_17085, partial [Gemmataceae bacterium]
ILRQRAMTEPASIPRELTASAGYGARGTIRRDRGNVPAIRASDVRQASRDCLALLAMKCA